MSCFFFFCKQKTAYEMRISDWSSDVCSSDLHYSIVYGIDENHVLKVAKQNDSGYARYADAAKKHKKNPHFPKILYSGEIAGKSIYVLDRKSVVWERVCQYV